MKAANFKVVDQVICAADLVPLVAGPGNGALCTFEGTVRDHTGDQETTHLEYEAYVAMAARVFADIAAAAIDRFGVAAVAIHHRTGRLEIGEVSVAIAVSSAHRAAAFDGCRFAIDQLKLSAPIWKKEFRPDSGGDGKFRGGHGQLMEIGNREGSAFRISATYERTVHPARGRHGGEPSATGSLRLASGEPVKPLGHSEIPAGDRLLMSFPGGGGYGAPSERDPEARRAEIEAGLVEEEA